MLAPSSASAVQTGHFTWQADDGLWYSTETDWNIANNIYLCNQAGLLEACAFIGASGPGEAPAPTAGTAELATGVYGDDFTGPIDDYCTEYPEDPICGLSTDPGSASNPILSTGSTINIDYVTLETTGLNSADVDNIVDDALAGMWNAAVAGVDAVTAAIVAEVQSALTAIGNALRAVWNVLAYLSGLILHLVQAMWSGIVKGLIAAVQAAKKVLDDLVDDVLQPLAQAMGTLRRWLIDLYQNWIRPVLIILQQLRQLLAVLRLFGLKFATKIDNALTDIQSRITQPLFFLLGYVNAVANWINLIVTAGYLIQKPLWLWSLNAYVGSSLNLQLGQMAQPVSAAGAAAIAAAPQTPPAGQSTADLNQFLATGTGALADSLSDYDPVFQAALAGTIVEP